VRRITVATPAGLTASRRSRPRLVCIRRTRARRKTSRCPNWQVINTSTVVTLSVGGNDLLGLQQRCANPAPYPTFADCVGANLQSVLQLYACNLTNILTALRANYKGTLILVTTYSPSADPLFDQVVGPLNQVLALVGAPFGTKFADVFTAFKLAAALFPGGERRPVQGGAARPPKSDDV
jgi:lysophospholipase L1-like esterase